MKAAHALMLCICCLSWLPAEDQYQDIFQEQDATWYNADTDSLQRARMSTPREPETSSGEGTSWSWGIADLFMILVYAFIIGLIVFLLLQVIIHFSRRGSNTVQQRLPEQKNIQAVRVTDLPFQTDANINDPAAAFESAWRQRQWPQLVIYAMILLLTELHRAQLIQLRPGKTNRRYLRELRRAPEQLRTVMQYSIDLFERSFFGHLPVSDQQAEQLYAAIHQAQTQIQRTGAGEHAPS